MAVRRPTTGVAAVVAVPEVPDFPNSADRVLWDTRPGSAAIKPEEFAATLCSDLALGSDFESGVALAVRHQLQRLQQRHTLGDAEAAAAAASASGAASGEPPSVVRGARETRPF